MTIFEELAERLGVLEVDENGLYTGRCKTLYQIHIEVMLSDNKKIRRMSYREKEEMIIRKFKEAYTV